MESTPQTGHACNKLLWIGRIISTLPVLMLLMSSVMKLTKSAVAVEGFSHFGYPDGLATGIGMLELVFTVLYVVPRTAILGAILLTAFLGGAAATHIRIGEPFVMPIILGALIWGGLYLRDARVRLLVPLRSKPVGPSTPVRTGFPVLKAIFGTLIAAVVVLALYIGLQPPAFRVTRSTTIAAPPAEVFQQVNDFHNWEKWSPWAKIDPACKITYDGPRAGMSAVYTWSGNDQVGEGRMTITEDHPPDLVRINLEFIRPFASTCTTEFRFQPENNQTLVTWTMSGEKNYIAKAFHLFVNMDKMIGGDFDKGLAQMKTVAESPGKK